MPVVSPLPELLENRQPVIVTAHSLAIDQAGPQSERVDGLDDQREAARPVVAVAGEQADAGRVAAGHQPIAVVLDLVNPVRAARWSFGGGRKAGLVEAGEHPLRESYDRGSAGDSDRTLFAGHHGLDGYAICRRRQSCRLRSAACAGSATVRAVSVIAPPAAE